MKNKLLFYILILLFSIKLCAQNNAADSFQTKIREERLEKISRLKAHYEFEKQIQEQKRAEEEALQAAQANKTRNNNIQYLCIAIVIALLYIITFILSRFTGTKRASGFMLKVSVLLLFGFLLTVLAPHVKKFSEESAIIYFVYYSLIIYIVIDLYRFIFKK